MNGIKYELIFCTTFVFILSRHVVVLQREVGDYCTTNDGNAGTCKSIYQCGPARTDYEVYGKRPTNCGYSGSTPIVCCVESRPGNSGGVRKSISERKCDEYSSMVKDKVMALPLLPDSDPISFETEKCDYGSTELIVGGHEVKLGEFPHMVAIGWDAITGNDYKWKCGGTLISDDYVLTAAHCTFVRADDVSGTEPTVVRLGEHNLFSNYDGASPKDVVISQIIVHPNYKPPKKYHDIALLKLQSSTKSIQNKYIRPACLWTKSTFDDRIATAIGWGLTENRTPSDVLKSVSLDIIDNRSCSRTYPRDKRKLTLGLIEQQMCAGNLTGGSDTCQGDSGGPLQVYSKANRCIHYIIGLTSFGNGCGNVNTAGVYTRISSYRNWIEETIWPGQA